MSHMYSACDLSKSCHNFGSGILNLEKGASGLQSRIAGV